VKALLNGTIVAESDETVEARGYHYFPREAVRMELLRATPRTERDLECPHGVQFYDVVEDAAIAERAAWSYEAPQPELEPVKHWIGFWHEVELEP
jgi:uncharacterized protein (DUF427 family)